MSDDLNPVTGEARTYDEPATPSPTYRQWQLGDKLLMSPEHPGGWKLEELIAQVMSELHVKCGKLKGDDRSIARLVLSNNQAILGLLRSAIECQLSSVKALDEFAPNQGPLGTPRIGIGSQPKAASTQEIAPEPTAANLPPEGTVE